MKILYSHYLDGDDHPAARMVGSIADELREFGNEVTTHPSRFASIMSESSLSRHRPGAKAWLCGRLWFARMLARDHRRREPDLEAIRLHRPDVVLARHDAYRSSMAWAATEAGVPLVTYADAPVAHEVRRYVEGSRWHPPGLVEAIERATLATSRRVVTVSNPAAEILGKYRVDTPIDVVPNGVDPRRFPMIEPDDRVRLRESLGVREPIVVGFQGTFKAFHGLDRLRELIASTANRHDVRWLLIGDGPGLPALRDCFEHRRDVTFLGRRRAEEIGCLLSLVDIAVAPYQINAGPFYFCPLKVLEYAAAGCAILAADQGDISSLLDGGRVGMLLREPGLDAWTEALATLFDDRPKRQALGDTARRWALERRTWRETARLVENSLIASIESESIQVLHHADPSDRNLTYIAGGRG